MTIVCVGCASTDAGKSGSCPCPQAKEPPKLLRHVVLFKFKDDATPDQIKAVEDAFRALPGKIDTIRDFEWGTNVSVENLAQGYTHCFFVTFQDEAGRAAYLPHPDHKAFGKVLHPYLDKVLVVDYWVKK
ncbi:MAG: Dabb family protein [Phycisphaerae bacterium]|nr:Dabb family protein [Phycisphaerae bacterium]